MAAMLLQRINKTVLCNTGVRVCRSSNKQFLLHSVTRSFGSDSHDDFKPKKKEVPTGMEEVLKVSISLYYCIYTLRTPCVLS